MTKEEKLTTLNECYGRLLSSGVVHNKKQFAEMLGIHRSTVSASFNGNETYLTDSLVSKVKEFVDKTELQTMFPAIAETKGGERVATLPIIPIDAMGGTLGEFAESVHLYDCERMISPIKGADYAMKVSGDSMSPEYPSGCQILIKKINEKAFIEWGKVYVLDTENGAVIKKIRRTSKDNIIECVSLNPEYQPFTIDTQYINGWYRVLLVMSLK